jgi:hypothetical protein
MKLRHIILAFAIIVAFVVPVSHVAAEDTSPTGDTENATPTKSESDTEDDWLTKLVDRYYDAVDSYNNQVIERNIAVSEASGAREEWRPRQTEALGPEATGLKFIERFNHYDDLYRISDARAKDPGLQKLIQEGAKRIAILSAHNVKKDDPRWVKLDNLIKEQRKKQRDAETNRDKWLEKRDEFDEELQKYKNKRGSYPPHDCTPAPLWHRSPGVTCTKEAKGSTDSDGHSDGHGH